ncbi:unnamed protein product [Vitrella brassicaformis CCMP3155]|uniref:Uncharacterized protein n=1 Tax=Vitrella brassicaformis (strain CCMP3155) TaxID=1169540 RepID=A0A0G4EKV2_VITBC|nr:unnamed protein product [Vitrella brassicaformis CCMP3155]|eukprot:CEL97135.1 unnamed protein product [Vitrella brassicaformis CCMP3155]
MRQWLEENRDGWWPTDAAAKLLARLTLVGSDHRSLPVIHARRRLHSFLQYYDEAGLLPRPTEASTRESTPSASVVRPDGTGPRVIRHVCSLGHTAQHPLGPAIPTSSSGEPRQSPSLKVPLNAVSYALKDDPEWNSRFGADISIHRVGFSQLAPFIKTPLILTRIPSVTCDRGLVSSKMLMLYEQFGQLLMSRPDWRGVYVIAQGKTFMNYSRLAWEDLATITDGKGRKMKLLRWRAK